MRYKEFEIHSIDSPMAFLEFQKYKFAVLRKC